MCSLTSEKSLEGKLMLRALCHVTALTQPAKGTFPNSCSFHSNLKERCSTHCCPACLPLWEIQPLPPRTQSKANCCLQFFLWCFPQISPAPNSVLCLGPWKSSDQLYCTTNPRQPCIHRGGFHRTGALSSCQRPARVPVSKGIFNAFMKLHFLFTFIPHLSLRNKSVVTWPCTKRHFNIT